MSDTTLFEQYYKSGFTDDYIKDRSHFTPADWRELIILALKIQKLSLRYSNRNDPGVQEKYNEIHGSIDRGFWDNLNANPKRDRPWLSNELYTAIFRIGIPLGMSVSGGGGGSDTLSGALVDYATRQELQPEVRDRLCAGLRGAVLTYDGSNYPVDIFNDMICLVESISAFAMGKELMWAPLLSAADIAHIGGVVAVMEPYYPDDKQRLMGSVQSLAAFTAG